METCELNYSRYSMIVTLRWDNISYRLSPGHKPLTAVPAAHQMQWLPRQQPSLTSD